jgi:drug/metabolite transporter (DMT)-like permease
MFPEKINAQAGMAAYYMIAVAVSLVIFFLTSKNKNFLLELKKINWATFSLALSCLGLDFGYILAFRAGWDVSFASFVCNILIAVSLIFVGVLFYHEIVNRNHVTGILLCFIGFTLITLIGVSVAFSFFLPILIIVVSNVVYDVSSKSINEDLNAYAGTTIIYSILAIFNFLVFEILNPAGSVITEWSQVNWAVATFALGSIGLESGYIFLFRVGWNISLGGMVCNILLAMSMLGVGQMLFNETVSLRQYSGVLLCIVGLIIIFRAGNEKKSSPESA